MGPKSIKYNEVIKLTIYCVFDISANMRWSY